jgi:hypothetical protein
MRLLSASGGYKVRILVFGTMKLQDIPDYRNKKVRRKTWCAKGYIQLKDGVWWSNQLTVRGYEFGPLKYDYEFLGWDNWEEYYEWKGEALEALHQLSNDLAREHHRQMTEVRKMVDEIERVA